MLDLLGQRYGVRPSALLAIADPILALTVDYWAAYYGAREEERRARDMKRYGR